MTYSDIISNTLPLPGMPDPAAQPRPPRERKPRPFEPSATEPQVVVRAGRVQLAVSPWGEVEVDGRPAGIAPPLNHLDLPPGAHTITVRNGDAPPQTRLVEVHPDQPVSLKFRF